MSKYYIGKVTGTKNGEKVDVNFWLENETFATPYDSFVVVDDSDYNGHYGPASIVFMGDMAFISIGELVYNWMHMDGRTEKELKAAQQFIAPVEHIFSNKSQE